MAGVTQERDLKIPEPAHPFPREVGAVGTDGPDLRARSRNRGIARSSSTRWVTHATQVEPR